MASGKKILYFIASSSPNDKEKAEATRLNTTMFRNASLFNEFEAVELCDAVAGAAPDVYRKRFDFVSAPESPPTQPAVTGQNPAPSTSGTPWSGQNK